MSQITKEDIEKKIDLNRRLAILKRGIMNRSHSRATGNIEQLKNTERYINNALDAFETTEDKQKRLPIGSRMRRLGNYALPLIPTYKNENLLNFDGNTNQEDIFQRQIKQEDTEGPKIDLVEPNVINYSSVLKNIANGFINDLETLNNIKQQEEFFQSFLKTIENIKDKLFKFQVEVDDVLEYNKVKKANLQKPGTQTNLLYSFIFNIMNFLENRYNEFVNEDVKSKSFSERVRADINKKIESIGSSFPSASQATSKLIKQIVKLSKKIVLRGFSIYFQSSRLQSKPSPKIPKSPTISDDDDIFSSLFSEPDPSPSEPGPSPSPPPSQRTREKKSNVQQKLTFEPDEDEPDEDEPDVDEKGQTGGRIRKAMKKPPNNYMKTLNVLLGSIGAGNNSKMLYNRTMNMLDKGVKKGYLTNQQAKAIVKKI